MSNTKKCNKCNRDLPATTEYFYERNGVESGFRAGCRECTRQYQLDYLASMTPEYRQAMKRAEKKRNAHVYRQATTKQVAIRHGVFHETWTERELLSKYGSDCYLCHKPIDLTLPRQGANSEYSLWPDHVVPMSRGGENTIRNVRPCHRKCNQNKYNLTYEEYVGSPEKGESDWQQNVRVIDKADAL